MRRVSRLCLALAALGLALGGPGAGAATARWTPAQLLRLPPSGTSVPQGYLPALACPGAGECVAAGNYVDGSFHTRGMTVSEVRGVWRPAVPIAAPGDAGVVPGMTPTAAACGAAGACVVVGSYTDAAGDVQAFVERESRHVWGRATRVPLPSDAAGSNQVAGLRAVGCSSATTCVAAGSYTTGLSGAAVVGLVVTIRAASVSSSEVDAPVAANVNPYLSLTQVACPRSAPCLAAGTFLDQDNATRGVAVWSNATSSPAVIAAPTNASAYPATTVGSLACTGASSCVLVGTYETAGSEREGYVVASARGAWPRSTELVMPGGAAPNPRVFSYDFAALACSARGECATGGQYVDAAGLHQGFLATEVRGVWRAATELALPGGAQQAGVNGGVVALTCPATGRCRAGAAYLDARGRYQAYVVAEAGDRWSLGTTLSLPPGAGSVGVDGGVYGLVCATPSRCSATGSYLDAQGYYQGFAASLG